MGDIDEMSFEIPEKVLLKLFLEKVADTLHIFHFKHPRSLSQLHLPQQHVVSRFGQVTLGLEEQALAVEYFNIGNKAHLVAQFVGVQSALAGGFCRLPSLDLAEA